jgi:hypothetical protein
MSNTGKRRNTSENDRNSGTPGQPRYGLPLKRCRAGFSNIARQTIRRDYPPVGRRAYESRPVVDICRTPCGPQDWPPKAADLVAERCSHAVQERSEYLFATCSQLVRNSTEALLSSEQRGLAQRSMLGVCYQYSPSAVQPRYPGVPKTRTSLSSFNLSMTSLRPPRLTTAASRVQARVCDVSSRGSRRNASEVL